VHHFPGRAECFWAAIQAPGAPEHPPLGSDLEVDVVVVGGGIVGLTAAWLLQQAGRRVALVEARRIGHQVTGRSTGKVTSQHGLIYGRLIKAFGEEGARIYAAANEAAIAQVASLVEGQGIACGFERRAAVVYGTSPDHRGEIEAEADAARRAGLQASYRLDLDLPFAAAAAVRFENQAQIDPCAYLLGLSRALAGSGARLFENTRALDIEHGEPCRVRTEGGMLICREVIEATHMPTGREGMFFTKAYPYGHPMVAARVDPARAPTEMLISSGTPTHSVRTARRGEDVYLVAVGGAYKPGHADDQLAMLEDLRGFLRDAFAIEAIDFHWANEDFSSMDGVPFIGRATSGRPHHHVATGFGAWGLSNGTAAGMILADLVLGRANPWAELFDATRMKPVAGGRSFMGENLAAGVEMAKGYLPRRARSMDDVAPGEAAVVKQSGERVAVFRDEGGSVHAVSAVCTHMGCVVGWNPLDRTWDCPCHGSRFALDGSVVNGPATTALVRKGAEETVA
jgi:glycine/D-amino acid oxidase-like deaminating enzyme/nitrite reductase/ring-hydroxylating ferredoxin subunit